MTQPTAAVSVLDFYQALEDASARMLEAAQADDWDRVVELEGVCAVLIERLREQAEAAPLSPVERAEKHRIMLAILRHDAQIRALAEPWLDVWGDAAPGGRAPLLH
ncbi:Flagellar protein FliT [Tepidimonas thermarum]|uniref:Flagellar protein FliT n=1 Tax=Tepidimonas thermarum TaxID=335431 RepID=A0A554WYR4_9BURK|nr:flagellar protein FliT [Tepidimonas thermarum]TSE28723.1 Flagellar protein FliT [Tepidimonas thermarum]